MIPDAFDRVELRAIRGKEQEDEVQLLQSTPLGMEDSVVVLGVIDDDNDATTAAPAQFAQEGPAGLGVKVTFGLGSNQATSRWVITLSWILGHAVRRKRIQPMRDEFRRKTLFSLAMRSPSMRHTDLAINSSSSMRYTHRYTHQALKWAMLRSDEKGGSVPQANVVRVLMEIETKSARMRKSAEANF